MIQQQIILALGSNLGDRLNHLNGAVNRLNEMIDDMRCSSVYETAAWGYEEQPNFLNMVLSGTYNGSAISLLRFCQTTERIIGRTPSFIYGPREIDIDILLYGNNVVEKDGLTIPHPSMSTRAFVLIPLAEIHPELIIPGISITVEGLVERIESTTSVVKWGSLGDCS